ncbi:MAG: hypothetical protein J6X18_00165 [Bacteroidales bacterium]|nr:hypothetical protein [Bacteroidales bacterium]
MFNKKTIKLNEQDFNNLVTECVKQVLKKHINENSVSKEGNTRRVFHFGEKFGNWELVLKDGCGYCFLRPISKNHIMPDGTHWDTVNTDIPADMFDKPRKELEEYLKGKIVDHYKKVQNFYKEHDEYLRNKEHEDSWEDDEFWSGGWA